MAAIVKNSVAALDGIEERLRTHYGKSGAEVLKAMKQQYRNNARIKGKLEDVKRKLVSEKHVAGNAFFKFMDV